MKKLLIHLAIGIFLANSSMAASNSTSTSHSSDSTNLWSAQNICILLATTGVGTALTDSLKRYVPVLGRKALDLFGAVVGHYFPAADPYGDFVRLHLANNPVLHIVEEYMNLLNTVYTVNSTFPGFSRSLAEGNDRANFDTPWAHVSFSFLYPGDDLLQDEGVLSLAMVPGGAAAMAGYLKDFFGEHGDVDRLLSDLNSAARRGRVAVDAHALKDPKGREFYEFSVLVPLEGTVQETARASASLSHDTETARPHPLYMLIKTEMKKPTGVDLFPVHSSPSQLFPVDAGAVTPPPPAQSHGLLHAALDGAGALAHTLLPAPYQETASIVLDGADALLTRAEEARPSRAVAAPASLDNMDTHEGGEDIALPAVPKKYSPTIRREVESDEHSSNL